MKLKDFLYALKSRTKTDSDTIYDHIMTQIETQYTAKRSSRVKWICSSIAAAMILVSVGLYSYHYFKFDTSSNIIGDTASLSQVTYVAADHMADNGAATNTTVSIVTKTSMSVDQLQEHLSVTPETSYTIQKRGTNRFSLTFDSPLESNTAYTINSKIGNSIVYRWSIQTNAPFSIEKTTPEGASQEVDCNAAIQITFSESGVNGFQEYFSIYPEIEGSFAHKGRIWIFTPSVAFSPYTTYTVTISGDIFGNDEKPLGEDHVFSFTTGSSDDRYAYVVRDQFDIADAFTTAQIPYLKMKAKGMSSTTADMTVYKLTDADAYLDLHQKYGHTAVISGAIAGDIKEAAYPIHSQFSVSAIPDPQEKELYHFNYPKEFESGYYVTEILWNGIKHYHMFQTGDLIVYTAENAEEYTVWVNNIQTKLPEAEAKIHVSEINAKTDDSGLAKIVPVFGQNEEFAYMLIESSTPNPYILCIQNPSLNTTDTPDYYHYLYTDSPTYSNADTVNIWGIITRRNPDASAPDAFLLLDDSRSYPISIDKNGAFNTSISLNGIEFGTSTLDLYINGVKCQTKTLQITDGTSITHNIDATAEKNAYLENETANIKLNAQYQSGVGAENVQISAPNQTSLTTDQNGNASYSLSLPYHLENRLDTLTTCSPSVYKVSFESGSNMSGSTEKLPLLVFKNDEYLQGTATIQTPNSCTLEISTHKIDFSKINRLSKIEFKDFLANLKTEDLLGDPIDKEVTIEVHEITFERAQSGTYYDVQQNKVQLKYNYTEKDTVIRTLTTKTENGKVILEDMSVPSSNGYRYINLIMKDASGKNCYTKLYLDAPIIANATDYEFICNSSVDHREELQLAVYDPSSKKDLQEGTFIYHLSSGHFVKNSVIKGNHTTFTYSDEIAPSLMVSGAYFDGENIYEIPTKEIDLSSAEKELNLKITTEQEQFRPGDTVSLNIEITDFEGNPVPNAAYNIHVMDAALANVVLDKNISNEIYKNMFDDAVSVNRDFLDSPAFLCGTTDKNGSASLTFTLPQANANWAIYGQAFTEDMCIGSSVKEISSRTDPDINFQATDKVKSSDDVVIAFSCNSDIATPETAIQSKILLLQDDIVKQTLQLQHPTDQVQYTNFGKLPQGEYQVKITSTLNTSTTTVEHGFTVAPTDFDLKTINEISSTQSIASNILLTDPAYDFYAEYLNMLLLNSDLRLDKALGNAYASCVLSSIDPMKSKKISSLLNDHMHQGGYSKYTTDEQADLFLTARIASLFPQQVDTTQTQAYFDQILCDEESTFEDILCALWGKAALGDAVEKDLAYYYAEGNGFTIEQQLYFALAYAYGGNQEKANEIYQNRLKTMLQQTDKFSYLQPENEEKADHCNALLSLLLSRISSTDAPQVFKYLLTAESETTLLALETIAFIKEYVPLLDGQNTVRITYSNARKETLIYNRCAYLWLENHDNNITSITPLQGKTTAKALQTVNQKAIIDKASKLGTIATYTPQEIALGSEFTMNISLTAAQGSAGKVQLSLPYGLQYLNRYSASQSNVSIQHDTASNKITISTDGKAITDIVLYCKAVLPGQFTLDPIFCLTNNGLSYYEGETTVIQITQAAPESDSGQNEYVQ